MINRTKRIPEIVSVPAKSIKMINRTKRVPEIVSVSTKSIKLWKNNPRINDKASEKLAKLIDKFGQRKAIIVWRKDMTVYAGNSTLKAIRLLKWNNIDVVFHDFKSEAEAVAFALSDNKASEWSDWDDDTLLGLMQSEELKLSSKNTGFTEKEIKAFRLSSELPDMLPDVDLQGIIDGKSDFMVIQFDTTDQMHKFRESFWKRPTLGSKLKNTRAIHFVDLKQYFDAGFLEEMGE